MRRTRILALVAAAAVLLLLWVRLASEREPPTLASGSDPASGAPASAVPGGDPPATHEPAPVAAGDVRTSAPAAGDGQAPLDGAEDAPGAAESPRRDPSSVPLEKLLRWSETPPQRGIDLSGAEPDTPAGSGTGSGLKDRVYVDRRSDDVARGSQERSLETTDVGVRVPVDDSVALRGGVRIESRDEGEASKQEKTPTVGVEVRF